MFADGYDFRCGIRARDTFVLEGDGVCADQHGDLAIVERYGVDLDRYIVWPESGRESLVVRAIDGERLVFGAFEGAAAPGGVACWVGHAA